MEPWFRASSFAPWNADQRLADVCYVFGRSEELRIAHCDDRSMVAMATHRAYSYAKYIENQILKERQDSNARQSYATADTPRHATMSVIVKQKPL